MAEEYYNTQVEIYDDSAPNTLLDVLNARIEPSVLEELRGHGGGSFSISKRDAKILANPSLIEFRKYVKIRMNGSVIGGFVIQTRKTVIIGSGEEADEAWAISGEGPRSWSRDAVVYPAKGLKSTSADTRYFNFATETGPWIISEDWVTPTNLYKYLGAGSPKKTAPAEWPDAPNAYWVWSRPVSGGIHPAGYVYFRHSFTVTGTEPLSHALFIAADDAAEVYVDGELLVTMEAPAWQNTTRVDFDLHPGTHVIGVKAYNQPKANGVNGRGPGGVIASLFKYGDPDVPTSATLLSYTGQATWKVNDYPEIEPGWTVGDVLITLLAEAETRGVRFAQNFTPTFTTEIDSAGNPWDDPVPWSFGTGATYEEVFSAAEELGCDIWVNPDTLELNVWKKRGTDKSASATPAAVIFQAGKNLMSAEETGQAEIANTLMLHAQDGWKEETTTTTSSITKYGRVEAQMSSQLTAKGSKNLVKEMFRLKALPEKSATFDIIPVTGSIPFVDFNVGDYVSAPGEVPGVLETRRVVSIAYSENSETGAPQFSLEFDSIFKDRQTELEKWVSRIANSGAIGGGFTNSSQLPPTTIKVPPGQETPTIPDAPTGLVVSSVGYYQPDGSSQADFSLTWNPVVTASGFETVTVDRYEVWGRPSAETGSTLQGVVYDTFSYLSGFRVGEDWSFMVRAISSSGGIGPFSAEVELESAKPLVPLAKPSTPTLETGMGSVVIKWNGLLGGSAAPPQYAYMIVERSTEAAPTTWTAITTMNRLSVTDNTPTVGEEYNYRITAVDRYGVASTPSDAATITVAGVDLEELAPDVVDAIENAVTTADGKNRIFAQTTEPVEDPDAPFAQGDQWWVVDVSDPNSFSGVKIWNGTDWVNFYFVADSIVVPGSVGNIVLAEGAVTADKIVAGSITVNELSPTVGDDLNLNGNVIINTLTDAQNAQSESLSAVQDDVDGLTESLAGVADLAGQAESEANASKEVADAALAAAQANGQLLEDMGQVYAFTSTGAVISGRDPSTGDSPYTFHMSNLGAEIRYKGDAVSVWDATQMIVNSFVGHEVVLGNHKLEKFDPDTDTGGTVVRKI
jgi:hypothetical protein